ncbi:MAG TPA: alkaline phosphatase family protein [Bryobacteraceae bacterium]|jgi:phospholipase C
MRQFLSLLTTEVLISGLLLNPGLVRAQSTAAPSSSAVTPIRHVVVIFQENVSFDHYFATYPNASNLDGEPAFHALATTPSVNGLAGPMLTSNPNMNGANGSAAANPFRLSRAQAATADQNHNYGPEQTAFHGGLMDLFPKMVGTAGPPPSGTPQFSTGALVMGYYDGNTVTALWNYAQHFAMSDNSYNTNFGPSTPGAINLISGQTNGVINNLNGTGALADGGGGTMTDISDADPAGDVCSTSTGEVFSMSGKNIGDLLNAAGVSWGFFSGGFDLTLTNADGSTGCSRSTTSMVTNTKKADYIPHHQPFQYYTSTANLKHTRPASAAMIGQAGDAANHQYDIHDFYDAITAGNFPAVSYLKAPGYQDGHAGYSDPLDEQQFIVHVINFLQGTSEWAHTAVIVAYDDSDGWYDHQMSPIVNQSTGSADALLGPGTCGDGTTALAGVNNNPHAQGRCGYGPRLPLMVISPWARPNFVDHTVTDQTSILRFVEDNWLNGQRIGAGSFDAMANSINNMFDFSKSSKTKLMLDESSGQVVKRGQ